MGTQHDDDLDLAHVEDDEADDDLPPGPRAKDAGSDASGADEPLGVDDAEALVSADIADGPEEVGLDTEAGLGRDGQDYGLLDDEPEGEADENEPLEGFEPELDADDEDEGGWTDDSEGSNEPVDTDAIADDETPLEDDGGLEGVDDPMLEGLSDELPPLLPDGASDEESDTLVEDLGDDWLKKIGGAR